MKKLELGTCSWTYAIFKFPSSLSYPTPFSIIFPLAISPLSFHIVMARQSIMNGSPLPPNGKSCYPARLTKLFPHIWNWNNERQHSIFYLTYNTQSMCGTAMAIFLALRGKLHAYWNQYIEEGGTKICRKEQNLLNLFELLDWAVAEMNLTPPQVYELIILFRLDLICIGLLLKSRSEPSVSLIPNDKIRIWTSCAWVQSPCFCNNFLLSPQSEYKFLVRTLN